MSTIIELLVSLAALNFTITGIESYIKMYNFQRESPIRITLNVFSAICAILLFFLHLNILLDKYEKKTEKQIFIKEDSLQVKEIPFQKLKATYYNPTQSQCDGDPLTTGSGYRINLRKLKKGKIKVVAVSRDLLKIYPYGSTIYVHQPVHLRGTYKVEDTMNKRFTKRIDFLSYGKVNVDSVHISL
jgi:3D (Asp-Asp-Asp) domain-containing protein